MTAKEILDKILIEYNQPFESLCDLNSACKNHHYLCGSCQSTYPVINFDKVNASYAKKNSSPIKKSVDAITNSPADSLCFIEIKSWVKFIQHQVADINEIEKDIEKKAKEYQRVCPLKLDDSVALIEAIINPDNLSKNSLSFIFVTDSPLTHGLTSLSLNLLLLSIAGTGQDIVTYCNSFSQQVLSGNPDIRSYYWPCTDFDREIQTI